MYSEGLSALPAVCCASGRALRSIGRPPGDIYRRDALNAPLCANDGGDVAAINLDPAPVRASRKRIERIVFGRGRSRVSACQKSFDKPADGRASSLTTAAPTSFLLKSFGFPGAKTARKRFLLWKMGFSAAFNRPAPVRASRKRIERIVFGRGRSRVSACQKSFDKPADGRTSSLTAAAPTSFFAEIFQISGRKNCKGTIFALENGIFRRFQSSRLTRTCRRVWLKIREDFDPLKFSEGFFDSLSRGRSHACEGQATQVSRLRAGAGMLPPRGQKRRARRRGESSGFRTKLWELTPSARTRRARTLCGAAADFADFIKGMRCARIPKRTRLLQNLI